MRTILIIPLYVLSVIVLLYSASIAEENHQDYFYPLKIKGGELYQVIKSDSGDSDKKTKKKVRVMEQVLLGAVLEISAGSEVLLTCLDCSVLSLTRKDSPYTVNMTDFKKVRSVPKELASIFKNILEEFIYPDSKTGRRVEMKVRGDAECRSLWPPNNKYIIPLNDTIVFKWDIEGKNFSVQIKEYGSNESVFLSETALNNIKIPANKFKPGSAYKWSIQIKKNNQRCDAFFALLSKDNAVQVNENLKEIVAVLPAEADNETKYRLQASYLLTEDLLYDAYQWLESNEVKPLFNKEIE